MVLAVSKPLTKLNGSRFKRRASPLAMMAAAADASLRGASKADDDLAARTATLMLAARAGVYVSIEVPIGNFTIIDPETLETGERLTCPFKVKTLVVHPEDIDQAITHFKSQAQS